MKLVSVDEFDWVVESLRTKEILYLDTETTGLRPHHGDRFFSIVIGSEEEIYYFNFQHYPEFDNEDFVLDMGFHFSILRRQLFEDRSSIHTWVLHNAKFDMSMLKIAGSELLGEIHCTMTIARVIDSEMQLGDFSLDVLGSRIGFSKDTKVKDDIKKNKLYTERTSEWTAAKSKDLHYNLVPFDIIAPYACRDVEVTRALYHHQMKKLHEIAAGMPANLPNILNVYAEEKKLLRTVFEMEYLGVKIDPDFCKAALLDARKTCEEMGERFKELTGEEFKTSGLVFQRVFESQRDKWVWGEVTATGKVNPSFNAEVLETFDHPAAKLILEYQAAKSNVNYYAGFLEQADANFEVHATFDQSGTTTGRFSSRNPNLQNMTKSEDDELLATYVVRRAIVPRPGNVFHMLDFKQMEYRVLLDYAGRFSDDKHGVHVLISKVCAGHDVHAATAELSGTTRTEAKRTNFAIIYGSGLDLLAKNLGVTKSRATEIRDSIFSASPEIRSLIRQVMSTAEKRAFIVNWFGRMLKITDPTKSYRGPNYLIQGGCADIVKVAMNRVRDYLMPFQSKMVLQVHDELVIEGPADEAATLIPEIQKIMESVYQFKFVPLAVDVEHSYKSLADKEEGIAS